MSSQTEKSRNPLISIIRMHDADLIKTMRGNSIKKKKSTVLIANERWNIWETHLFIAAAWNGFVFG